MRPPSRHRPATLKDVARDLGLSVATVSRALAKPNLLRPATAARVREAVDRLGYRPNLAAQNLKRGSTGIIYVVVPSLSPFSWRFSEVPNGRRWSEVIHRYGSYGPPPRQRERVFEKFPAVRVTASCWFSSAEAVTIVNDKHNCRRLSPFWIPWKTSIFPQFVSIM